MSVILILDHDPHRAQELDAALSRQGFLTIVAYRASGAAAAVQNISNIRTIIAYHNHGNEPHASEFFEYLELERPHITRILCSQTYETDKNKLFYDYLFPIHDRLETFTFALADILNGPNEARVR